MDKDTNKYAVLNDGEIINIVISQEEYALNQGLIKYEDGWQIGNKLELIDGKWEAVIDQKKIILSELALLDIAITPRTIRQAALGDATAINKIKEVEKKADELREKLQKR